MGHYCQAEQRMSGFEGEWVGSRGEVFFCFSWLAFGGRRILGCKDVEGLDDMGCGQVV